MPEPAQVTFATTRSIRDRCLCLHTQRAARVLGRRFDEALRPLGLSNGQFSLLAALNRPEPARMGAVARVLGMDRTTLTAALKPLQGRGLIHVAVDAEDRRSRVLALTPAGQALLAAAVPVWRRAHADLDKLLGNTDPGMLRQGLRALS